MRYLPMSNKQSPDLAVKNIKRNYEYEIERSAENP